MDYGEHRESVCAAVVTLYARYGLPPTMREIQRETGIKSLSNVAYHIEALVARGRLVRLGPPGASRGVAPAEVLNPSGSEAADRITELCRGRVAVSASELLDLARELRRAGRKAAA